MFEPRPPIAFAPRDARKEPLAINGVGSFLSAFELTPPPSSDEVFEPPKERKKRMHHELGTVITVDIAL